MVYLLKRGLAPLAGLARSHTHSPTFDGRSDVHPGAYEPARKSDANERCRVADGAVDAICHAIDHGRCYNFSCLANRRWCSALSPGMAGTERHPELYGERVGLVMDHADCCRAWQWKCDCCAKYRCSAAGGSANW